MSKRAKDLVGALELGTLQAFENLAVYPLFLEGGGGGKAKGRAADGPAYLTLDDAVAGGVLKVGEVSAGGHVPELAAVNESDTPVVVFDGEELVGAKQNRIVNTTIMIPGKATITIPVSCVEQGRWSYRSELFRSSDASSSSAVRMLKMAHVHHNLEFCNSFLADQGAVWDEVASMACRANVSSATGAMRDVFERKRADLDAYVGAFACAADQRGMLVVIGGRVVGLDVVPRADAFAKLFTKLIRSYAMDASLAAAEDRQAQGKEAAQGEEAQAAAARAFLDAAAGCRERTYKSPGAGDDHRFEGAGVIGSALVVEDALVHAAFFADAARVPVTGGMASGARRAGYRRRRSA